jgi:hypothetical protein
MVNGLKQPHHQLLDLTQVGGDSKRELDTQTTSMIDENDDIAKLVYNDVSLKNRLKLTQYSIPLKQNSNSVSYRSII